MFSEGVIGGSNIEALEVWSNADLHNEWMLTCSTLNADLHKEMLTY